MMYDIVLLHKLFMTYKFLLCSIDKGYEHTKTKNLKCMKGSVMFALPLKKGVCYTSNAVCILN